MLRNNTTEVHPIPMDKQFPEVLPFRELRDICNLHAMCAMSVQACVQEFWGQTPRCVDGGEDLVTNLKVALGETHIEISLLER